MRPKSVLDVCFFRSTCEIESEDLYLQRTEVVVLGDVSAYRGLLRILKRAETARRNIHVPIASFKRTCSMAAVVLPAASSPRRAVLCMIERPVLIDGIEAMELVLYGNVQGYRCLADSIRHLLSEHTGDLYEHEHVDHPSEKFVAPGSLCLNIRGPAIRWDKRHLEFWWDIVRSAKSATFPTGLDVRNVAARPYSELRPKGRPRSGDDWI